MQAKRRQQSGCFVAVFLSISCFMTGAGHAALPEGLPQLPETGERMLVSRTSGIALGGYDAVAYQVSSQPVAGVPAHEAVWAGVTWRFSSQANKAAFLADPEAYAPLFDGYDPLGVAQKRAVESDPYVFAVLKGRLFLFHTPKSRERFMADSTVVNMAAKIWPDVARQLSR